MILITGATGTNGSAVAKLLAGRKASVRALVRNPEKAGALKLPGVEIAQGDYSDLTSLERAMQGVERVFLLSPVDLRQPVLEANVVNAAKKAGVRHIVKFSVIHAAADSTSQLVRWHHETEELIRASGLAFTFLRPNMFMQEILRQAQSIKAAGQFYLPLGEQRVSLTDVRDIAEVAAAVLTKPGHEGKTYNLTGPAALTFNEVAAELTKVAGRDVAYIPIPEQQFAQGFEQTGAPRWLVDEVCELYRSFPGKNDKVFGGVREVLGREATSFAGFARDHAAAFKA